MIARDEKGMRELCERLCERYGVPRRKARGSVLDCLIGTILSQNTSSNNSSLAFRRLKEKFRSWDELAAAPTRSIASAIRVAGLSNIKAPRIKKIVRRVKEEKGSASLDFIRGWDAKKALDYLLSLDGVGLKTALCVLLFSCGKGVFPVDTHIMRISKRLGLIPQNASADAAHELLGKVVPSEIAYPLHLLMIRHGREVCHPRNPDCAECVLIQHCSFYHRTERRNT